MKNTGIDTPRRRIAVRLSFQMLLALLLVYCAGAQSRPAEPKLQGEGTLKVMTFNTYVGTEYSGITDPSLPVVQQAVTHMILDARASDPAGRAQAVARQIVATKPHLVSLQEVGTWSTGTSLDNLTVEFDYLQLLVDSLASMGVRYTPVTSFETWQATLLSSMGVYVHNSWRVAILARADLSAEDFSITNADGGPWVATQIYPLAALNGRADLCPVGLTGTSCLMPFPRGWASVDVAYRGKQFRFINAHLDSLSANKNRLQGIELLNGPAKTALPVVIAADLNCDLSNPSDSKYQTCINILNAGFVDSWGAANPGETGFTKDLPMMTMRGDYVMARGPFGFQASVLVGEDPADKTLSGLWPSNHSGVVSRLQLADEE